MHCRQLTIEACGFIDFTDIHFHVPSNEPEFRGDSFSTKKCLDANHDLFEDSHHDVCILVG